MPKEMIECGLEVKEISKGKDLDFKVILEMRDTTNKTILEYPLEVSKDYLSFFYPGARYKGIFQQSGMPDFIGDKDVWENVCTVSFLLKKILDGEKIIYEAEK